MNLSFVLAGYLFMLAPPAVDDTAPPNASLLAAGSKIVKDLPVLEVGKTMSSFFEILMGPENSIGYVVATIVPIQENKRLVYKYQSDTVIHGPTQARIRAMMDARLKPNFEPFQVIMRRGNAGPTGDKKLVGVRADFDDEGIAITVFDGEQRNTRRVEKLEPPVIFAIEMFVQLLDTSRREPFTIREFSANAGAAGELAFNYEVWRDGSLTLITRPEGAELGYQFWFDEDNKLLRWTHVTMPILFVRSTAERIESLKAQFGEPIELEINLEPMEPDNPKE